MQGNLAGVKSGVAERFVPDQDRGRLIEAEHLARYLWAAAAAKDRSVLDAGCGAAYGSRLLADGGAREVFGVDNAEAVLEAAAPSMPDTVQLQLGDVRALEFEDGRFELVVCFEVIEHVDEPEPVLDELVRVLAPGGLLLISSPNRGVYPGGNPHHRHELTPDELESSLTARLSHVRLLRQHDYLTSAVLSDTGYERGAGARIDDVALRKLVPGRPGEEVYTIALASHSELPALGQLAAITGPLELREWQAASDVQTRAITDKDNHIADLEASLEERERLSALLVDAEQRLAAVPELELRIADLEFELKRAHAETEAARAEARDYDERLMRAERVLVDMFNSPSWQVTKPLRRAKKLLR